MADAPTVRSWSRSLTVAALALGLVACGSARPEPPVRDAEAQRAPTLDATAVVDPALARQTASGDAGSEADAASAATATRAQGAALYGRMCAVCHGEAGEGYRADQATALAHPDFLASVSDEFLRFAIAFGRRGTTMSAWGKQHGGPLAPDDIDALVLHLRSWQKTPSQDPDSSASMGNADHGKQVFRRACQECHGDKGPYVRIQNRQWLVHADQGFIRHAIVKGRANTKMPAFAETLGRGDIDDVIAYLKSLPSWLVPGELPGTAPETPIPLGRIPLNPKGPAPRGFRAFPAMTSVDVVAPALARGARMMLLDARVPSDYLEQHIAGAVSVPFYDPFPYLDALPRDTWLVCYCGCPHAESGQLARLLMQRGFTKVTVLDEGLYVWGERGHPLRSGLEGDAGAAK